MTLLKLALGGVLLGGVTSAIAQSLPQLTVDDAVRSAWDHNPSLAAMRAEVRQADRQWAAARARRAPQFFANLFGSQSQSGAILNSGPTWMAVPAAQSAIANVMAMIPLSTGGVLEASERAAWWGRQAAAAELVEAEAEVAQNVHASLLELRWHEARLTALRAQADRLDELERTTRAKIEQGKDIESSALRILADRKRLDREVARVQADRTKALLAFRSLVGADLGQPSALPSVTSIQPDAADPVSVATKSRGLIRAAQARLASAEQEVKMAEGDRRPQWSAVAMADAASMRGMGGATVGITMSVPLGDGGGRRATVDAARAMDEKRRAELQDATRVVELEVRQTLADVAAEQATVTSAQESVTSAEEGVRVMSLRVEVGKAILLEQLDALQMLAEARLDLAEANYRLALAQTQLRRFTGDPAFTKGDKS